MENGENGMRVETKRNETRTKENAFGRTFFIMPPGLNL